MKIFKVINNILNNTIYPFIDKVYNHPYIYPFLHPLYTVLSTTINNYNRHKVFRLGAALAYYTIFSLPALIIVIIGLVGFFLGEAAVRGEVYSSLVDSVGPAAAEQVQNAVLNIGTPNTNWWATVIGVGVLIFVATGVFYALQDTLNHIFEVKQVPRKVRILEVIINRVLSLGMVLSIGALLLLSIILNALLLKIHDFVTENQAFVFSKIPKFLVPYFDYLTDYFLIFLNLGLSVFLIALFFSMLYKILPAVKLQWKYIWAGSFAAAILFWIGEMVMGVYLSRTDVISAYGAAGSLIVILMWVSYSSQLIFLGAEFIIALCEYQNVEIKPKKFAIALHGRKRKKKITKIPRAQLEDIANDIFIDSPLSYFEQGIDLIDEETEDQIEEEISNKNEELGFNDDKNIDLTSDKD